MSRWRTSLLPALLSAVLAWLPIGAAAEIVTESFEVPLTDVARRGLLRVDVNHGSVSVRGVDRSTVGLEVAVEAASANQERSDGLAAVPNAHLDLDIRELDNRVEVQSHSGRHLDLTIEVPREFDVEIRLYVSSETGLSVTGLSGVVESRIAEGPIRLLRLSGAAVVHTDDGELEVELLAAAAGQPMSFTTARGDIDVTLPAELGATATIESDTGNVYSDFELVPIRQKPKASRAAPGFSARLGGLVKYELNGGGLAVTFKSLRGDVRIRRGESP